MSDRRRSLLVIILFALVGCANAFGWRYPFALSEQPLSVVDPNGSEKPFRSWIGSQTCGWLTSCVLERPPSRSLENFKWNPDTHSELLAGNSLNSENEGRARSESGTSQSQVIHEIPQYVLDHAPLVHLYSGENFWPCDMVDHLSHVTPNLNYTPIQARTHTLNLTNLDELNEWNNGRFVYLTSDDNVEGRPDWLGGEKNIPDLPEGLSGRQSVDSEGRNCQDGVTLSSEAPEESQVRDLKKRTRRQVKLDPKFSQYPPSKAKAEKYLKDKPVDPAEEIRIRQLAGRSDAPAVLIVVNKGHGIVDAFWFFFYSYNLGNVVFNVRFGNHVGDWEHTLVRFHNGKPKYVFFSEHNFGEAYGYGAVEKIGKRVRIRSSLLLECSLNRPLLKPVVYSATGTHAMYATSGVHPYILPLGILHDQTDRGPLWDPVLNSHTYTYDYLSDDLRASNITPQAPTEWFYFGGHWGDKFYPLNDPRQYHFAGQYHYVTGPLGPRFKNLGRRKVCQGKYSDPCVIKNWLAPVTANYREGNGEGEFKLSPENDEGV